MSAKPGALCQSAIPAPGLLPPTARASNSTLLRAPLPAISLVATPHNLHTALPTPPTATRLRSHRLHRALLLPSPALPSTSRHLRCDAWSAAPHAPRLTV